MNKTSKEQIMHMLIDFRTKKNAESRVLKKVIDQTVQKTEEHLIFKVRHHCTSYNANN